MIVIFDLAKLASIPEAGAEVVILGTLTRPFKVHEQPEGGVSAVLLQSDTQTHNFAFVPRTPHFLILVFFGPVQFNLLRSRS